MWFRSFRRRNAKDAPQAVPPAPAAAQPAPAPARALPRLPDLPQPADEGAPNRRSARDWELPPAPRAPMANMWDSVGGPAPERRSEQGAVPLPSGAERARTRLLDLDEDDGPRDAIADGLRAGRPGHVRFPVGWLIVVEGPGRGACFALASGVSQIGRGEDETVSLNFGDMAISRNAHASVAYDAETHEFYIGHGGKKNIVRRNGKPVLATEPLHSRDLIRIGETTLLFVALCDARFNWEDGTSLPAEQQAEGAA